MDALADWQELIRRSADPPIRYGIFPAPCRVMPSRAAAKRVLTDRFGHEDFQKGQWEPISAALSGRDALVVMPTGSGKSLVYQLPALMLEGLTVVVSPLIALMKDQQDKLSAHGIHALAMHSHLSDAEARRLAVEVQGGGGEILYL